MGLPMIDSFPEKGRERSQDYAAWTYRRDAAKHTLATPLGIVERPA